jgi:hypothetical protein
MWALCGVAEWSPSVALAGEINTVEDLVTSTTLFWYVQAGMTPVAEPRGEPPRETWLLTRLFISHKQ